MNPLQRKHADLGCRAAWGGKTTNLAACRQDPVAGDNQRHRILRHGLANIARGFRSGAEFLRQSAISGRATPFDLSRRGINTLEERGLLTEVELEPGKIRLLALKIALYSGDSFDHLRRGRARFGAGRSAEQHSLGPVTAFCRQLEARDAQVVPSDPAKTAPGFENKKWCAA